MIVAAHRSLGDESRDPWEYAEYIVTIVGLLLLVAVSVRRCRDDSSHTPEENREREHRQRILMRRARLRRLGINPYYASRGYDVDNGSGDVPRLISAVEAEEKRKEWKTFLAEKSLSMTLESHDFDFVDEACAENRPQDAAKAESGCIRRRCESSGKDVQYISSSCCVICLDSYHEGDEVVWSDQCSHCLHLECALDYFVYLRDDSHPCPICRQTFIQSPWDVDTAATIDMDQQEEDVGDVAEPQWNRDDDVPV